MENDKNPLTPPLPPLVPPTTPKQIPNPPKPSSFKKSIVLRIFAVLVLIFSASKMFIPLNSYSYSFFNGGIFSVTVLPIFSILSSLIVLFSKNRTLYNLAKIILIIILVIFIISSLIPLIFLIGLALMWRG